MQELNVKTYLLLPLVMLAAPAQAADSSPQINIIFSGENASCDAWMKSANNKLVRGQYEIWARGFASGYNFANPLEQVKVGAFPSGDNLAKYFDQYCRDNPQQTFVAGAIQLIAQLSESAKPVKPAPRAPAKKS